MYNPINQKTMRPERLTQRQAQNAWNAIQKTVTLATFNGQGVKLPEIDMAAIFSGRKSMTWQAVTNAVVARINQAIPT